VAMDAAHAVPQEPTASGELTAREREILAFERQWWKYAGAKEQAVRELFDMSTTRYYQLLNALIDRPEALAYDPMLVKRLRRMRQARQRARTGRHPRVHGGSPCAPPVGSGSPGTAARIRPAGGVKGAIHEQQHPTG